MILSEEIRPEWFHKLKNNEFNENDKELRGISKVYKDVELEELEENSCQENSTHTL